MVPFLEVGQVPSSPRLCHAYAWPRRLFRHPLCHHSRMCPRWPAQHPTPSVTKSPPHYWISELVALSSSAGPCNHTILQVWVGEGKGGKGNCLASHTFMDDLKLKARHFHHRGWHIKHTGMQESWEEIFTFQHTLGCTGTDPLHVL